MDGRGDIRRAAARLRRAGPAGEVAPARGADGKGPALEGGADGGAVEQFDARGVHEVQRAQVEDDAGAWAAVLVEALLELGAGRLVELPGGGEGDDLAVGG